MRTLLRRAIATGVPVHSLVKLLVTFGTSVPLENMHPLQTGILRLMRPSERRPGMPRENPLIFWPRLVWQTVRKNVLIASQIVSLVMAARSIAREAGAKQYLDQALTPVSDDGDETLDLLTKTTGSLAAVSHIKKVAGLVDAGRAVA
jgi:hypothetical protein